MSELMFYIDGPRQMTYEPATGLTRETTPEDRQSPEWMRLQASMDAWMSQPDEPEIDVDRLARAILASEVRTVWGAERGYDACTPGEAAEAIAREYALTRP